jgi:Right handed beta helix region
MATAASQNSAGPRTYYVARWGNDRNPGTSPSRPWRSVDKVNRAALIPGDKVLFRGGETFTDDTLMPGRGWLASGTASAPITFSSYGGGRAVLQRGIWLGSNRDLPDGPSHLVFRYLALGPYGGFQGTASYVSLTGLTVTDLAAPYAEVGIETEGSHWRIIGNTVDGTGDSGMLLGFEPTDPGDAPGGSDYLVARNVITHTGLDPRLTYGTHGIYAKVANATIVGNRITQFRNDGVSVRYRNARVMNNYISTGDIGIGWFQYDTRPGVSVFAQNKIDDTNNAAIFVCGEQEGCMAPLESFVIRRNVLSNTHGDSLNLQPSHGNYRVARNSRSQ